MMKYKDYPEEVMIIGGGELFNYFLPHCEKLYIAYVKKEFQGDTYFPLEKLKDFTEVNRETMLDEHSGIELDFTVYQKKEKI